eukprot:scaffold341_cov368-Pavlova_lutheri.AAC.14
MASAAIAPKCFYRLQGVMKRKYGVSEVSSPFDCKRRRSRDECVQCVACRRYFHRACNAELRQMFAHGQESETDSPVVEEDSSPIPPLAEAGDASMQDDVDRSALCWICEAGDQLE